jgi:hypothetical protein
VTHICKYADNKPYFNKEGFLEDPTPDDPWRLLCLDFDCYCSICDEIRKEDARDAFEESRREKEG